MHDLYQDISQKSSNLLRLNLSLNNLVHSLNNVVQGNTILSPAHKDASGCLKNLISLFPIRRLNWISAISAIGWKAMKTTNAFCWYPENRQQRKRRWKSISFYPAYSVQPERKRQGSDCITDRLYHGKIGHR